MHSGAAPVGAAPLFYKGPRRKSARDGSLVEALTRDGRPRILIGHLPGRGKDDMGNLGHPLVLDLVGLIVHAVIVIVRAGEEEDERDIVLAEVPVVASTVELVRVILGVEPLVQLHLGAEGLVGPDVDIVQFLGDEVGADNVDIVGVLVGMGRVDATDHVYVQVRHRSIKRHNGFPVRVVGRAKESFLFS